MAPFSLKVLVHFGLCSNSSQKLDECSLARTRKISLNCSHAGILVKILCRVAGA